MPNPNDTTRQVPLHDRWRNEAQHFTPWLSKNLHLLGNALDMNLEFVQREAPAGPYSLDILARDTRTGAFVAIENQFGEADHSHLGQSLTYASERNARVVIWMAEGFNNTRRKAVYWLNEWTHDEIQFYGVEARLTKTGNSHNAPTLHIVSGPDGWERRTQSPTGRAHTPLGRKALNAAKPLVADALKAGFGSDIQYAANGSGKYPVGRNFRTQYRRALGYEADAGYVAYWWPSIAGVGLFIRGDSPEIFARVFKDLEADKKQIHASLGFNLRWQRFVGNLSGDISTSRRNCSLDDPPEKQAETRVWMLGILQQFRTTFDPYLEETIRRAPN